MGSCPLQPRPEGRGSGCQRRYFAGRSPAFRLGLSKNYFSIASILRASEERDQLVQTRRLACPDPCWQHYPFSDGPTTRQTRSAMRRWPADVKWMPSSHGMSTDPVRFYPPNIEFTETEKPGIWGSPRSCCLALKSSGSASGRKTVTVRKTGSAIQTSGTPASR
jgi:hypothetical protein